MVGFSSHQSFALIPTILGESPHKFRMNPVWDFSKLLPPFLEHYTLAYNYIAPHDADVVNAHSFFISTIRSRKAKKGKFKEAWTYSTRKVHNHHYPPQPTIYQNAIKYRWRKKKKKKKRFLGHSLMLHGHDPWTLVVHRLSLYAFHVCMQTLGSDL